MGYSNWSLSSLCRRYKHVMKHRDYVWGYLTLLVYVLDTLPKVTAGCHFRSKVRQFFTSLAVEVFYHVKILKKHSEHTCTTFKLIQMRVEDNQRWWQIQNPVPFPKWYTPKMMGNLHAVWEMAHGVKGFSLQEYDTENHPKKQ